MKGQVATKACEQIYRRDGRQFSGSAVCLLLCAYTAFAQPSLTTLLSSGPVSNRYNIVFLSEGYTSSQLGQFAIDATNALNGLLSGLPWSSYANYINAYAIAVASAQSGSDHPAYGLYRDTYFNSSYDALSDYLITIPPNGFDTKYGNGQGKVDALLQNFVPNCALAILLVNDPVPGGSDGFNRTAIVYSGSGFRDILRHEAGHVAANLGDEYTLAHPGFPDAEEPNTTQQTNRSLIKWRAWIAADTPVPTPATWSYASAAGLFQGAHYHTNGWYRPKLDCIMNHPSFGEYCEVCREALVLSLYRKVRPVDAWSPAATNLQITSAQPPTFSLSLAGSSSPSLAVQWFTNGAPVSNGTNATLTVAPSTFGQGNCVLIAVVHDATPLVRTDPGNLLSQTVTWQLNVALPELVLDSPLMLADGGFVFRVTGVAPGGFVIQTSQDTGAWQNLMTNFLSGGRCWVTNSGPTNVSRMFRAVALP
jgi:hypothetical protein